MVKIVFNNYTFLFTILGCFSSLSHLTFFTLTFSYYIIFTHILSFGNIFVTIFFKCIFAKAHQNTRILQHIIQFSNWSQIANLKQSQIELLQVVTQLNKFCSKLILTYFILNIPINAYLLVLLLQGKITGSNALILSMFVLSQLNAIMFLHLLAAYLSKAMHSFSKMLLSIACQISGSLSKLQVEFLIGAWHTKNSYGLMYGKL